MVVVAKNRNRSDLVGLAAFAEFTSPCGQLVYKIHRILFYAIFLVVAFRRRWLASKAFIQQLDMIEKREGDDRKREGRGKEEGEGQRDARSLGEFPAHVTWK